MGRPAKSPEAKAAAGNPGKRRLPKPMERPAAPSISPPAWLTDADALAMWVETVPALAHSRLLAPVDRSVFARYCKHFADWLSATRTLDEDGMTQDVPLTGRDETMKRMHPLVRIRDNAEKRLIELEDRFGLNPAARYALVTKMVQRPGAFGGLFGDQSVPAQDETTGEPPVPGEPSGPLAPQSATSPLGALRLQ